MKIVTIVEENRPALLAEITNLLETAKVNVRDINGDLAGDKVVITLLADPYEHCYSTLVDAGFKVLASDHIVLKLEDQPGALADVSRTLANEQIEIQSIHVINKEAGQSIVALQVENPYRAGQVLRDLMVRDA